MRHTHQTQRTDLWCKCGGGTDFTSSSTEVDDFDFIRILSEVDDDCSYKPHEYSRISGPFFQYRDYQRARSGNDHEDLEFKLR